MKIVAVLVAVLLVISVAYADVDEKCTNWKCPKDLRKVSGIRSDGSCVTFNNHCLLHHGMVCDEISFDKCFRGASCYPDETRVIGCDHHAHKHKHE